MKKFGKIVGYTLATCAVLGICMGLGAVLTPIIEPLNTVAVESVDTMLGIEEVKEEPLEPDFHPSE